MKKGFTNKKKEIEIHNDIKKEKKEKKTNEFLTY